MENGYYEGIINQVSPRLALCDIPELKTTIKIGGKFLKKALDGDKVLLKVKDNKYGFVQRVIERNKRSLTGQIQIGKGYAFIKPWNTNLYKDFFVDKKYIGDVKDGDVVEFEYLGWGKKDRSPKAKVIKPIYNASETQYMMYKLDLPTKFPSEVVEEVKNITLTKNDFIGRSQKLKKEMKALGEDLVEVRHAQEKSSQKMDLIVKELKRTAGMEEVMTLRKYVDLWNPLNFVTQRDVERVVEAKLGEKKRVEKTKGDE